MGKKSKRLCLMAGCLQEVPAPRLFFCDDHRREDSNPPIGRVEEVCMDENGISFRGKLNEMIDPNAMLKLNGFINHDPLDDQHDGVLEVTKDFESLLIEKWAMELDRIYENRTAGDHTFSGVLHNFLKEVDAVR